MIFSFWQVSFFKMADIWQMTNNSCLWQFEDYQQCFCGVFQKWRSYTMFKLYIHARTATVQTTVVSGSEWVNVTSCITCNAMMGLLRMKVVIKPDQWDINNIDNGHHNDGFTSSVSMTGTSDSGNKITSSLVSDGSCSWSHEGKRFSSGYIHYKSGSFRATN